MTVAARITRIGKAYFRWAKTSGDHSDSAFHGFTAGWRAHEEMIMTTTTADDLERKLAQLRGETPNPPQPPQPDPEPTPPDVEDEPEQEEAEDEEDEEEEEAKPA